MTYRITKEGLEEAVKAGVKAADREEIRNILSSGYVLAPNLQGIVWFYDDFTQSGLRGYNPYGAAGGNLNLDPSIRGAHIGSALTLTTSPIAGNYISARYDLGQVPNKRNGLELWFALPVSGSWNFFGFGIEHFLGDGYVHWYGVNYFQTDNKWYIWRSLEAGEELIEQILAEAGEGGEGSTIPIWHHAKLIIDEDNHVFESFICDDIEISNIVGKSEYLRRSASPVTYSNKKHFRCYFIVKSAGEAVNFHISNIVLTHSEPEV